MFYKKVGILLGGYSEYGFINNKIEVIIKIYNLINFFISDSPSSKISSVRLNDYMTNDISVMFDGSQKLLYSTLFTNFP